MFDSTVKKQLIGMTIYLAITATAKIAICKMMENYMRTQFTQEKLQQLYFTKSSK